MNISTTDTSMSTSIECGYLNRIISLYSRNKHFYEQIKENQTKINLLVKELSSKENQGVVDRIVKELNLKETQEVDISDEELNDKDNNNHSIPSEMKNYTQEQVGALMKTYMTMKNMCPHADKIETLEKQCPFLNTNKKSECPYKSKKVAQVIETD